MKLLFLAFTIFLLSGCATSDQCTETDPNKISNYCMVFGQKQLDSHLQEMEGEVAQLQAEISLAETSLAETVAELEAAQSRVKEVEGLTKEAADARRKMRAELNLLKMDLAQKESELANLNSTINDLKSEKSEKEEINMQLTVAQEQLARNKKQIEAMRQYLKEDLLIRVENAERFQ